MKTKNWMIIIASVLLLCIGLSILVMRNQKKATANIISDGKVIQTVDLSENQEFVVTGGNGGKNTIVVRDGKICVKEADCPDQICVLMGWQDGGLPIACLPNQMIITFPDAD